MGTPGAVPNHNHAEFDYDHPDLAGLNALHEAKQQHPSLPILMLTQPNSEALAVCALRTTARQSTYPAITYVYNHFHEKVPLDTVSKHYAGVTPSKYRMHGN